MIITTAIPKITDEFGSITDIGWYGAAFYLTSCAFQPLFGKLYSFLSIKAVLLTSIFLFEVGSLVCGTAPNSAALIIGRAIAGWGTAGISSGAVSLAAITPFLVKKVRHRLTLISRSSPSHTWFRCTSGQCIRVCMGRYSAWHRLLAHCWEERLPRKPLGDGASTSTSRLEG